MFELRKVLYIFHRSFECWYTHKMFLFTIILQKVRKNLQIVAGTFPVIRFPVIRYPVIRYPVIRYPVIRFPVIRFPVIRFPVIRFPVIRFPVIRFPVIREHARY